MSKWLSSLFLLCVGLLAAGNAVPGYKLETIGPCPNSEISDAMKKSLQDEGFRVTGDSGPLCEIWLRKVLPQNAGAGSDYSTLASGTFVGVIQYLGNGGDYRGRPIKPAAYTLRYQTMPSDGNHMGVAPAPDFFVLLPPGADKDPDAALEYADLIKLGKQASGTTHINPLYLTAPTGSGGPSIQAVDDSHWALQVKTKAQPKGGAAADFPIALILIGKSESD